MEVNDSGVTPVAGRVPSLWYGSESQRTLLAELAYDRLVFQAGASVELGTLRTWHTAFRVRYRTDRGIDLERGCLEGQQLGRGPCREMLSYKHAEGDIHNIVTGQPALVERTGRPLVAEECE